MRYKALDSCLSWAAFALCLWALGASGVFSTRYGFLDGWHLALDLPIVMAGYLFASQSGQRTTGGRSDFQPMLVQQTISQLVLVGLTSVTTLLLLLVLGLADPLAWIARSAGPQSAPRDTLVLIASSLATLILLSMVAAAVRRLPIRLRTLIALMLSGLGLVLLLAFQHRAPDQGAEIVVRVMAGFWVGFGARLVRPPLERSDSGAQKSSALNPGTLNPGSLTGIARLEAVILAGAVGLVLLVPEGGWQLLAPLVFGLLCWVLGAEVGTVSGWLRRSPLNSFGSLAFAWPLTAAGLSLLLAYKLDLILHLRLLWTMELADADPGFQLLSFDLMLASAFVALSFLTAVVFEQIASLVASLTVSSLAVSGLAVSGSATDSPTRQRGGQRLPGASLTAGSGGSRYGQLAAGE